MLAKAKDTGASILCDACQTEIGSNGLVLWKFTGKPTTNVLTVHATCEQSPIVDMLMSPHRSMPLGLYLEQLLEHISV